MQFQVAHGLCCPPSQETLEQFVTFCASTLHLGYVTIKSYLCGVRHHFILRGYSDVTSDKPRLLLTLRGIKKCQAPQGIKRIPLSADIMNCLHSILGSSANYDDIMLWAVLTAGYFGGFRAGELLSKGPLCSDDHLCREDVSLEYDVNIKRPFLSIHLKSSKTDPFRQGVNVLLFATGQLLCPYSAVMKYLSVYSCCVPHAPFFILHSGAPLTYKCFSGMLKVAVARAGVDPDLVSTHSMRKGFATSLSAARVPDHIISAMGRWSSDCYKRYISTPKSAVANAQIALANPTLPYLV